MNELLLLQNLKIVYECYIRLRNSKEDKEFVISNK